MKRMLTTRPEKRTTTTRACPVQVALEAAHARAAAIGRPLHPVEVRWSVRFAFRARYELDSVMVNQFADATMERIRQMIEGER